MDEDYCLTCGQRKHGRLHGGLNFRLRQLIGCEIEVQLENNERMYGEVSFVGNNFVELIIINHYNRLTATDFLVDREQKKDDPNANRYFTTIYSIDQIEKITLLCSHCQCM